jgi:Xaa-Pro dipeptidase
VSDLQSVGIAPLPEGGRVDFDRLRAERRQRILEAMQGARVDVLLLGRPANIAFASGARQLWTSGTRPFAPGCVVVGATGAVHLLSTWDEGVPAEIPRGNLFGLSWNPAIALSRLKGIGGLAAATRVGTDGWGPGTEQLVASLCPQAEAVDASRVLRMARTAKSPDEMACLATAAAVAEAALSAMSEALQPGVTERELVGVYASAVAGLGLPTPPTEGVAWVSSASPDLNLSVRPRRVASDRPLAEGDLVALNPGAMYCGYEATVGRTRVVGGSIPPGASRAAQSARTALDAVMGVCQPGATGAHLLDAWAASGGSSLCEPLAWGLGMGVEPPVVGPDVGRGALLHPGAVLAVQAWSFVPEVGGILEQDVLSIGPEGPTLVTRSRSGLAGGGTRA